MKIASTHPLNHLRLLLALAFANTALANTELETGLVQFKNQNLSIEVEIAANQQQRETGLMNRQSLAANKGMLFVYNDQDLRGVWMKNTLLPLDVLFLNHQAEIVAMLPNLQPCRQNPCPIYHSQLPATYMLEVNAGFINNHQLKIGQALGLPF
jgi:uncharacterized membrane protein (UPF0127 family)